MASRFVDSHNDNGLQKERHELIVYNLGADMFV